MWEDKIAQYIADKDDVTVSEIMEGPLKIETPRLDRKGQNRVMKILHNLGWERSGRVGKGRTAWVRRKPND